MSSQAKRIYPGQSLYEAPVTQVYPQGTSASRVLDDKERHENAVILWNTIAIDTSGVDHTLAKKDQGGPTRASRAIAMVQVAVADALALATKAFKPYYTNYPAVQITPGNISLPAAVGAAAFRVLYVLFPQQSARLQKLYDDFKNSFALLPLQTFVNAGIDLGRTVADKVLQNRQGDGSDVPEQNWGTGPADYHAQGFYGEWQMDPFSKTPVALGSLWGNVKPFVLTSGNQFRIPAFPSFSSPEFGTAYQEEKSLGGDDVHTATVRTQDQTETGIFWAYDGTPSLCAPPRLYNYLALHIAKQKGTTDNMVELARLLSLVNLAMADAGIACWDSKYFHRIARPVTFIPNAVTSPEVQPNPPTGAYGSTFTTPDPTWAPLGIPNSNATGENITPPFPSYPSGHGTFGAALFQVLRTYYGTDDIPFTFVSEEYNGITVGPDGQVRPNKPRSYANMAQAEEENGQSRIYLGIHWAQDKVQGIALGRKVGNAVIASVHGRN